MVTSFERHLTHICPMCGMVTTRLFSPFAFSGRDEIEILCPNPLCGSPCLTIHDNKTRYSFSAECPVCGDHHDYHFRRQDVWQKPIVSLSCLATGVGICFIGEKDEIKKELSKAQKDYSSLEAENGDFYSDYIPPGGNAEQGEKISLASELLHDLSDEKRLACRCGCRTISITLIDNALVLRCARCRSMKRIEPTNEFLRGLASTDSYIFNN